MSYSTAYDREEGIAIVGMAGRFPGARNIAQLWRNLLEARETISHFRADELEAAAADDMAARASPAYVRARGILDDIEMFDAGFFGINPKEAEILDPQQRVFLETAWEALEDAGCDPQRFGGPIGVFAGASNNYYYLQNLLHRGDVTDLVGWLTTMMGNEKDYLTTRVAYKLDLKGPALNIQTACSTSLVAVCSAVQSLLSYQCDMALAGGVSITLPQRRGYLWREGFITSPDGHCRAFDRDAQGTVFSNGVGIVVLRRLRDARADGDTIYAVIKGAALNNDGNTKVSFTAPSVDGHAQVISMAQALAGIDPETISYIEAHGTGTPLGDPVEIAGLTQAFRAGGARGKAYCAIGSLKTNVGHLDAAAGIGGLIKATLALHHRLLPASLHFTSPNPKLGLEDSPFYVNARLQSWRPGATPRRAGVSSFGVGGTNAHVVLEEAPAAEPRDPARNRQLMVLSARSPDALDQAAARLKAHLAASESIDLANAEYTLQTGRRAFSHRRALICGDRDETLQLLAQPDPKRVLSGNAERQLTWVAFLFPGQGAQQVNMGRALYESEARFRTEVDECSQVLQQHLGVDLRTILYPPDAGVAAAQERITQTAVTQPALFVIEYALARLWMAWGIEPAAMIGHSLGEYVAACLAGVFTRDDALHLLARRGRMMQDLPPGSMLAVRSSVDEIAPDLGPRVAVAALNAPSLTVISGDHAAVADLEARLTARQLACRRLPTSHAFHSPMMEPIVADFTEFVRTVARAAPTRRWISGLTGELITDAEATDPAYWAQQLRQPVRFMAGVGKLMDPNLVLLEVGPGQALTSLARQHPDRKAEQLVLTSMQGGGADLDDLLAAAARLWTAGGCIDWSAFHAGSKRRRISLPTYPFERRRLWVEAAAAITESRPLPTPTAPRESAPLEDAMPESTATQSAADRSAPLIQRLQILFSELSGIDAAMLDPTRTFLELGLDSLFLTQASGAIPKHFGVKIALRDLLGDCSTLQALAARVVSTMPADPAPERIAPAPAPSRTPAAPGVARDAAAADAGSLQQVLAQQLELMARQLDILRGAGLLGARGSAPTAAAPEAPAAVVAKAAAPADRAPIAFGPYRPPAKGATGGLTPTQEQHLRAFVDLYTRRTAGSKQSTASNRAHLSDPRSVAGFRQIWKETVYPIVVNRSSGSRLWDVDGNEYIDLTNGFGTILFGHNPDFIREAITAQLGQGIEIGPQTPLAGEVARLICELSGMERAAFCNTGSEAVTAAIRVARTVSNRDKIVMFAGAYHGIFDEVLVRPTVVGGALRATPIAPGIPPNMADNVVVLEYGSPESLQTIKAMGRQLAAVLVEPVQSRRPDLQPREFLQDLRKITAESETALILDEVVTGFRTHPGGAQALFGVRADIATYGKVIGGGLPIGIVAGRSTYLDALDGGMWRYGDDSYPEVGVTFFAGTFVRHPLALAAARAVLLRLREEGPELQRNLNLRTTGFVDMLNAHAEKARAPVRVTHFGSWFCVNFPHDLPLASLFYAFMRAKGMHIWEGRPGFLTLAHTDADLERAVTAFKETLAEMQAADFLPGGDERPPVHGARRGRDPAGRKAWFVPDPSRPGKYLQVRESAGAT
ncbi:MAG TPA: aminotransferase class III-fold pyridoxal phosphate-dependent enzyme [Gemmatimonadales bacterium]|nr:aminotransferase class III-fold pyridoxal phosphate-dependent enzyme [Gemmatimonadales bacterium]